MKFIRLIAVSCLVIITAQAVAQQSILWEISGNGLSSPSYMMGTLKFIGEKEFFIPAEAHASLKNKAVHFPEGKSLKTELKPDDYAALTHFFEREFKVPASKFEHQYGKLIPLALSISMTRLSLGERVKFYDIELLKEAKKNKLETYSLEPIEREAQALHEYPINDQIKALMHSVANFETQKKEFQQVMKDYPQGDLEEIFQYTLHPTENNPVFIEAFYTKRNQEWLPKLDKMMHENSSFIAIGVSHLEGEKGMLALLKEKGYTLTPVKITR
jgi:uncharacterized protein